MSILHFSIRRKIIQFLNWFGGIGRSTVAMLEQVGGLSILLWKTFKALFTYKWRRDHFFEQLLRIGVTSLPLVALTALFTGMVLCLQSAYQLKMFNVIRYTAGLVSLSITRELGPVLTAMVVGGRVGAAITAEIGTMKVTEQVDALSTLGANPIKYLVIPRVVAGLLMLPLLTVFADFIGMFGGYLVATFRLGLSSSLYIYDTFQSLVLKDIVTGLIKAIAFGGIITIVGCYYGFNAKGGAEGVGRATTMSVVTALILVIATDCFFTAIFYFVLP